MNNDERGQAAKEAFLLLAVILVAVASLQVVGRNTNKVNNAVATAEGRMEEFVSELSVQYGVDASVEDWRWQGDNMVFTVSMKGSLPGDVNENDVESEGEDMVEAALSDMGGDYGVKIRLERLTRGSV